MKEITEGVKNVSITATGDLHKKNRIQVSNTKKPFFFYVKLSKRYMQQYREVELSALGLVSVAEILKNNGFAVEKKITTSIVEIRDYSRGRPVSKAKIVLRITEKFDESMAASVEREAAETEEGT